MRILIPGGSLSLYVSDGIRISQFKLSLYQLWISWSIQLLWLSLANSVVGFKGIPNTSLDVAKSLSKRCGLPSAYAPSNADTSANDSNANLVMAHFPSYNEIK